MMFKVHDAGPAYFFLWMMLVVLIALWVGHKEDKDE